MQNKKFIKNRVDDNISGNKGFYSISEELYKSILNDMDPREILSLFGHADQYNEFYNLFHDSNLNIVYIDKKFIFEKILNTKNVDLINLALGFEPTYQYRAYDFLRECDDIKFTCEFIYGVDFDWNNYFEFLKALDLNVIDKKVLWNKVVQKNELNLKKMVELLDDERLFVLRIMYLMNLDAKFKVYGTNIVNRKLGLCCPIGEIKKIDENFYAKKVIHLEKEYYNSIIEDKSPQISFDDLNLNDEPCDENQDPRKILINN